MNQNQQNQNALMSELYSMERLLERIIDVMQGIHEELQKLNKKEKDNEKKPQ